MIYSFMFVVACDDGVANKSFHSNPVDQNKRLTKTNVHEFWLYGKLSHSDILRTTINFGTVFFVCLG